MLELVLHFSGEAGAVIADLLQVFLLFWAGDEERRQQREEGLDLLEESPGDIGDATQGLDEVFFAFYSIELNLLFMHGLLPPLTDDLQVEVVPLFSDLLHFPPYHHSCLSEV